MQRREFITLLGGAAVAWPLAVRAQQPMPVIGILYKAGQRPLLPPQIAAFREGLRDAGYVEGQNIIIEYRAAERPDQLPNLAAEVVRLQVQVIVAAGSEAVRAAQDATKHIPIVMTSSSDPVGSGFVASLARPGGNITGMSVASPDLAGKRLELLREIVGEIPVIAVLWNPDDPPAVQSLKETEIAARRLGITVQTVEVRAPTDFDSALASAMTARPKALNVLTAPIMTNYASRIAEFALKNGLPAISYTEQFPKAGGLMSYGPNIPDSYRRAAVYVAKILKGAKPADLPVQQPVKFELVINLKTAKALGLAVPPTLLFRADEVIE
jgi:putative tryptophan/tyrosine transport system substrate-binding protein